VVESIRDVAVPDVTVGVRVSRGPKDHLDPRKALCRHESDVGKPLEAAISSASIQNQTQGSRFLSDEEDAACLDGLEREAHAFRPLEVPNEVPILAAGPAQNWVNV